MIEFFWSVNISCLFIWIVLLIYGFYKYHRKTDFRDIAIVHFVFSIILIYLCQYANVAILSGIELGLMLYGFYKFSIKADLSNVSVSHYVFSILSFFLCGYCTVAALFGIEHLHLLPFMPLGIMTIGRWYQLYPTVVITGIIGTVSGLSLIYHLLARQYLLKFKYTILAALLSVFFIGGGASFFYVLSWNIF